MKLHKRGFTLLEVFVSLGLIAILMAILLPVFARAREKARAQTCLGHMKEISLAISIYQHDFDDHIPDTVWEMQDGVWVSPLWSLVRLDAFHLQCPSDSKVPALLTSADFPGTSYGIRMDLCGAREEEMECEPDTTPLVLDMTQPYWVCKNWQDLGCAGKYPEFEVLQTTESMDYRLLRLHRGAVNTLFLDGHVKSVPVVDFRKMLREAGPLVRKQTERSAEAEGP